MSVADDNLDVSRSSRGARGLGRLGHLRTRHPRLTRALVTGGELALWIAFYAAVRALAG